MRRATDRAKGVAEHAVAQTGAVVDERGEQRPVHAAGVSDNGAGVTVRTRSNGNGHVIVAIQDRGIGIAPEDMARIFDPYFTTRRAGTGLGLPISRNIIEGMGGRLAVASERGVGTEIRIDLPITPPEAHA